MIKVRDKPVPFSQITRTHIFAAKIPLYTSVEWKNGKPTKEPDEELKQLQKIGPNKAMTLDKAIFVYLSTEQEVFPCTVIHKHVEV